MKVSKAQSKALEEATVWLLRKDGMAAREAGGLARKAIRAYEREVASERKSARSATRMVQGKHK